MLNLLGFGSSSIPKSLNCLMAYQKRTKKKKLCKVSICLFLSGIVNSICALFVTRCSPLHNPGRSHPELMLSSLSTGTISFSHQAKRLLKLIASKSCSKRYFLLYQTFVKHVKAFAKASLHVSWKCTAFFNHSEGQIYTVDVHCFQWRLKRGHDSERAGERTGGGGHQQIFSQPFISAWYFKNDTHAAACSTIACYWYAIQWDHKTNPLSVVQNHSVCCEQGLFTVKIKIAVKIAFVCCPDTLVRK